MWAITPTFAIIIAFLSWVGFCWARIWFFTPNRGQRGVILSALGLIFQRGFFVCYFFLGIFLLDIVSRICFLDLISYGSFRYIAAPVILCTALGLLYLLRSALLSPARNELAVFACMAGMYLYESAIARSPQLYASLFMGLGLMLFFTVIDVLRTGAREWKRRRAHEEAASKVPVVFSTPMWDLSRQCHCFAGTVLYAVTILLLSAELVLQLEGMSLLCWL